MFYTKKNLEKIFTEAQGFYNKQQYQKSFELYKTAAENGHTESQASLGFSYLKGYGTAQDYSKAATWLKKAASAGHQYAQANLGYCFRNGYGVPKDMKQGALWTQKSADQNCPLGLNNLGFCYHYGYGVEKNLQKALEYYKRAADLGHGLGKENYKILKEELDASTQKSPDKIFAEALKLHNEQQYQKAFPLMKQAAELGEPTAQQLLGYYYHNAKGTQQNYDQAIYWYRKSAGQKNSNALSQLGFCYLKGAGVPQSNPEAFYWFKEAAALNSPMGTNNLAYCYENGIGTAVDKQKALELYKKAYDLGVKESLEYYERVKKQLNTASPTVQTPKAAPPAPSAPAKPAIQELNELIGLSNVKKEVHDMISLMQYQQRRKAENKPVAPISRHMVFTGNPGTGKTTVARIIAKIYYELGLIEKPTVIEADRSDLVAEFIGQTAPKTKKKIQEALGGILFIDEAYTLIKKDSGNDFGQEAIDTLLKEMEDNRDRLIVIAAGYTKEMHSFINSNPGLKSRFNTFIEFEDYDAEAMKAIFHQIAAKEAYTVDPSADRELDAYFERLYRTRTAQFANGREVRNFYQKVITNRVKRVARLSTDDDRILSTDIQSCTKAENTPQKQTALERLQSMIGLHSVKQEITELVYLANYQKMCQDNGMAFSPISLHLVFTGNPGTGKTTVARLIAEIYHDIGLLPTKNCIETDRSGLVGEYVGHTAPKTQEVIDRALGGVLFIDEAYTLIKKDSGKDFGQEAIDTLLKAMEDNRENLVVIVAGYTEEMREFISSNPGLESRFTKYIRFDDYTPEELEKIFLHQSKQTLSADASILLPQIISRIHENRGSHFGNGREIRNYYEAVVKKLALRIGQNPNTPKDQWNVIQSEDLISAEQEYFKTHTETNRKTKDRDPIGFYP